MNIVPNKHCPIKKVRVTINQPLWMNREYCYLTTQAHRIKRQAIKTKTTDDWTEYKKFRDKAHIMKAKLKLESIANYSNTSEKNSKAARENLQL